MAKSIWTRIAPGSYEAVIPELTTVNRPEGTLLRVFRNCDCGHCPAWVATMSDSDCFEEERMESIGTLREAKEVALSFAGIRLTDETKEV